jgi:hypothetical protein
METQQLEPLKILESLQKVNNELTSIKKDQEGYGYKFRGIDQVLNMLSPLLKKHSIIVRREVVNFQRGQYKDTKDRMVNTVTIVFKYHFTSTIDGSFVTSMGIGEGEDRGDKATGCAISNSYKYVIFEMFNIATDDMVDSDQKFAKENTNKTASLKNESPLKNETKIEMKEEVKEKVKEEQKEKTSSFRKKKVSNVLKGDDSGL